MSTLNGDLVPIMLYISIAVGIFLTWIVFDKTQKKIQELLH